MVVDDVIEHQVGQFIGQTAGDKCLLRTHSIGLLRCEGTKHWVSEIAAPNRYVKAAVAAIYLVWCITPQPLPVRDVGHGEYPGLPFLTHDVEECRYRSQNRDSHANEQAILCREWQHS